MSKPQLPLPTAPLATQRQFEYDGLTWLYLRDPRPEHARYLHEQFALAQSHQDDILARSPRPKIEEHVSPAYLFLVLHMPVRNELARLPVTSEVVIIVGDDFVVTICNGLLLPLLHLAQDAERPAGCQALLGRGAGHLLYRILRALIESCMAMLYRLDAALQEVDLTMFRAETLRVVRDLSYIRRDVISLRRIIRPNMPVVRAIAARPRPFLPLDAQTDFDDLTDNLARIWDMLEEQKEIIEGLNATLDSVTSHRINLEMRSFTLISIIFVPMTLVASILGMNVTIPFADHPLALPLSLVLMVGMAFGLLAIIRSQRWM